MRSQTSHRTEKETRSQTSHRTEKEKRVAKPATVPLPTPRRLIGVLSHAVHVGTEVRKTLKIFAAEVRS